MIQLNCPLVCLDVESTGDMPKIDRVCQIALIKTYPDGRVTEWETLVNPRVPIPPEVSKVHGITDEDVKDAPTFEDIGMKLAAGLQKCDYLGYNLAKFDLPMLAEEFRRIRMRPEQILNGRIVDVFKVYLRYERRTLSDAVKKYLGEEHVDAHDAMGDVRATMRVFEAQIAAHDDLPNNVEDIHRLLFETPREGAVDPDGKLVMRNGEVVIAFGQHQGKRIKDIGTDWLKWVLKSEFTPSVMDAIRTELERRASAGN